MDKTFTGKTLDDAVAKACEYLGIPQEGFYDYEIVSEPTKGFLGIGSKPAVIKIQDGKNSVDTEKYGVVGKNDAEVFLSEYLRKLLSKMGVSEYDESVELNDNVINIHLKGEELNFYTKKNSDIVESLQFLLAVTVNKVFDSSYKVTLNFNDYKEKSAARLEALAVKTADRVLKTKKKVTLQPMSSYQRRIVHAKLHDAENITTFSVGSEPNRKVVIAYDGPDRPFMKKESDGNQSFDSRSRSNRGGGKPFNPAGLNKSRSPRRNNERRPVSEAPSQRVEKVKVLYPGPGFDGNDGSSGFGEE